MKYLITLDFFRADISHKEVAPLLTKVAQELARIEGAHVTLVSNNFIGGRKLLYTNNMEAATDGHRESLPRPG